MNKTIITKEIIGFQLCRIFFVIFLIQICISDLTGLIFLMKFAFITACIKPTHYYFWSARIFFWNARKSGHRHFWTHDSLDMNAQIIKFGTHEFSFGTHESLDIGNFERTKVWTWGLLNARWTHEKFWTHESLDIGTFRLGGSGHRHFPSGTVWTYRLSVWHLNLGSSSWVDVETNVVPVANSHMVDFHVSSHPVTLVDWTDVHSLWICAEFCFPRNSSCERT